MVSTAGAIDYGHVAHRKEVCSRRGSPCQYPYQQGLPPAAGQWFRRGVTAPRVGPPRLPATESPSMQPPSEVPRRLFLLAALGAAGSAVSSLSACGAPLAASGAGTGREGEGSEIGQSLLIPPLAPARLEGNRRVFDLVTQEGRTAVVSGGRADTWGVNGSFLGPTLRVTRGEEVQINLRNDLSEPTTLHWHGMHLPAAADGGPHQMVPPGGEWSPSWQVNQPAATLWYHPHPHGQTEAHAYRGIAGMFIIDDAEPGGVSLPGEYGVDDIPVIVQDKGFDDDGRLIEPGRSTNGRLRNVILVNGTANASFDVSARKTRLRLLNASTARSYSFGFPNNREFTMIASDGGLLPSPISLTRITLTPGERAEIIITMEAGEQIRLLSYPPPLNAPGTGAEEPLDVLRLRAVGKLRESPELAGQLCSIDSLDPAIAAATREFRLGNDRINDEPMSMTRIDEVVTANTVELWDVVNTTTAAHNFHVHGTHFQVISVDGKPPAAELAGWKDTVYAPPETPDPACDDLHGTCGPGDALHVPLPPPPA